MTSGNTSVDALPSRGAAGNGFELAAEALRERFSERRFLERRFLERRSWRSGSPAGSSCIPLRWSTAPLLLDVAAGIGTMRRKRGSGMTARRTILGAVLTALALTVGAMNGLAHAKGPYGSVSVAGWSGGAYTDDNNGKFSSCVASASYKSGINFGVLALPTYNW